MIDLILSLNMFQKNFLLSLHEQILQTKILVLRFSKISRVKINFSK